MRCSLRYFDYKKAALEAKIAPRELRALARMVRQDFPDDQMMFELHVLRACNSVRDGRAKIRNLLGEGHAGARK